MSELTETPITRDLYAEISANNLSAYNARDDYEKTAGIYPDEINQHPCPDFANNDNIPVSKRYGTIWFEIAEAINTNNPTELIDNLHHLDLYGEELKKFAKQEYGTDGYLSKSFVGNIRGGHNCWSDGTLWIKEDTAYYGAPPLSEGWQSLGSLSEILDVFFTEYTTSDKLIEKEREIFSYLLSEYIDMKLLQKCKSIQKKLDDNLIIIKEAPSFYTWVGSQASYDMFIEKIDRYTDSADAVKYYFQLKSGNPIQYNREYAFITIKVNEVGTFAYFVAKCYQNKLFTFQNNDYLVYLVSICKKNNTKPATKNTFNSPTIKDDYKKKTVDSLIDQIIAIK